MEEEERGGWEGGEGGGRGGGETNEYCRKKGLILLSEFGLRHRHHKVSETKYMS